MIGKDVGKGLRSVGHFLFHRRRARRFLLDVNLPAGEPRRQARVLAFLPDRERELIFVD
mgnify:CR=1 FL=1